ncbi:hypothetical protein AX15_000259 [Amanita polypyramis BW_CC]|nr:hypothetical protein AX15_000259 [Amanita polypyramis BW_CC]
MAEASLLESFPSPPTFIPNPPSSLPPALPLPPIPGPSPISDNFLRRSIASYRDSIDDSPLAPALDVLDDDDDDDDDDAIPARRTHHYNESISDIQLPLDDQDDEDDSVHTAIYASRVSFADPVDPVAVHLQIRTTRSCSESDKQILRARSTSPSRAPRHPRNFPPPLPVPSPSEIPPEPRSVSPDISTLLSTTPRPRRFQSSLFSGTMETSLDSHPLLRPVSDGDIAIEHSRWSANDTQPFNTDYAVAFPSQHPNGAEIEEKLVRQLEGADSDSDSSLDLHTPLPRLMVRDGLLSPRSKLLPQPEHPFSSDFRGSMYSVVSTMSAMTKSGVMKDERDTPMRRHRHRDGKLLRGGIGLTTGLGWSDSEDEDAPSPLTRRLSSLNLSRRSSASSVRSTPVHPLSRTFSGSGLFEEYENRDSDTIVRQRSNTLSITSRYSQKHSHPPTSWQTRPHTNSRLSSSSSGSKDSLQLSIPERPEQGLEIQPSTSESDNPHQDNPNTPSSASSLSIPMPSTPGDESLRKPTTVIGNKNKSLPPLPSLSVRQLPSKSSIASGRSLPRPRTISSTSSVSSAPHSPLMAPPPLPAQNGTATPRPLKLPEAYRRQSRSQPQTPTYRGGGVDRPAVPVPGVSYLNSDLRPLTTSTSNPVLSTSTSVLRPVSRLPSRSPISPSTGSSLPSLQSTSTLPSDVDKPKPRPRIGSGMVYRTSSHSGLDATTMAGGSKLRMPKSLTLASTSVNSPTPRSVSTSLPAPRPGVLRPSTGIPRTIAF